MEGADHFIRRVRRVEVYTNGNLKCVAIPVAGIEDNICDCHLLLFSTLVQSR